MAAGGCLAGCGRSGRPQFPHMFLTAYDRAPPSEHTRHPPHQSTRACQQSTRALPNEHIALPSEHMHVHQSTQPNPIRAQLFRHSTLPQALPSEHTCTSIRAHTSFHQQDTPQASIRKHTRASTRAHIALPSDQKTRGRSHQSTHALSIREHAFCFGTTDVHLRTLSLPPALLSQPRRLPSEHKALQFHQ
jgi:hypothetical protein